MTGPGVVTQGALSLTRLTILPDSMASSAIYSVTLSQQLKMLICLLVNQEYVGLKYYHGRDARNLMTINISFKM